MTPGPTILMLQFMFESFPGIKPAKDTNLVAKKSLLGIGKHKCLTPTKTEMNTAAFVGSQISARDLSDLWRWVRNSFAQKASKHIKNAPKKSKTDTKSAS